MTWKAVRLIHKGPVEWFISVLKACLSDKTDRIRSNQPVRTTLNQLFIGRILELLLREWLVHHIAQPFA